MPKRTSQGASFSEMVLRNWELFGDVSFPCYAGEVPVHCRFLRQHKGGIVQVRVAGEEFPGVFGSLESAVDAVNEHVSKNVGRILLENYADEKLIVAMRKEEDGKKYHVIYPVPKGYMGTGACFATMKEALEAIIEVRKDAKG